MTAEALTQKEIDGYLSDACTPTSEESKMTAEEEDALREYAKIVAQSAENYLSFQLQESFSVVVEDVGTIDTITEGHLPADRVLTFACEYEGFAHGQTLVNFGYKEASQLAVQMLGGGEPSKEFDDLDASAIWEIVSQTLSAAAKLLSSELGTEITAKMPEDTEVSESFAGLFDRLSALIPVELRLSERQIVVIYGIMSVDLNVHFVEIPSEGLIECLTKAAAGVMEAVDDSAPETEESREIGVQSHVALSYRMTKDQINELVGIHQVFARNLATSFSDLLRLDVEVKFVAVDQIYFEEFVQVLPNPTLLSLIRMKPLDGYAFMEFSPTLSFPIVDRLAGGSGERLEKNREPTRIERAVIKRSIVECLRCWRDCWAEVYPLDIALEALETRPSALRGEYAEGDPVILLTFVVSFCEINGCLFFCLPCRMLLPIAMDLSAWAKRRFSPDVAFQTESARLKDIQLPMFTAEGETQITARDFIANKNKEEDAEKRALLCVGTDYRFYFNEKTGRRIQGKRLSNLFGEDNDVDGHKQETESDSSEESFSADQ